MGNFMSANVQQEITYVGVFGKELNQLNNEINNIIHKKGAFKNKSYNVSLKSVCDKYTFVIEKHLHKHLKIDLQDLNSSIYMIPKRRDNIEYEGRTITKHELCNNISQYYVRILRILHTIRLVYDLENGGENSIAGLMMKNLKILDDNVVEVNYCQSMQQDTNLYLTSTFNGFVDMKQLKGLHNFVNHVLSKEESKMFLTHYKELFGKNSNNVIAKQVCNDTLVDLQSYSRIYNKTFNCQKTQSGGNDGVQKPSKLYFKIYENNPILNWNLCTRHKKNIMSMTNDLNNLIKNFKKNYVTNVSNVLKIVTDITVHNKTNNTTELKALTDAQLSLIETQFKKQIITFFLQSLIDFKNILDYSNSNPKLTT